MPTRIIAIANQKGGVGKTTTTVNLGTALADMGRRVVIIDDDPQASATSGLGVYHDPDRLSVYDVIVLGRLLAEARMPTSIPNLDLVPSDIALAGSEIELVSLPRREQRLKYALEGLGLLTHTIGLLRRELNPHLQLEGILLTLFDPRLTLATQVVEEVRRRFTDDTFDTVIPRNVRLSEAPSHGLPISRYDPGCRGALAYGQLAAELDARVMGRVRGGEVPAGAGA